jgi:asparagine synthase (glutamine-hydrolysing)
MCGIAGIFGEGWTRAQLEAMVHSQSHRGPDATGHETLGGGQVGLGHNRLSIIDLSQAGRQPMSNEDGSLWLVFNGEIYNYLELRAELSEYSYHSRTDSEVILAAYERWGDSCLDRFIGMFAFLLWDARNGRLLAARDRFGVKPLYYARHQDGSLMCASEIKAIHAGGLRAQIDERSWATYLATGLHEHTGRTFWHGVSALPPGHLLIWQKGQTRIRRWYDIAQTSGDRFDSRPIDEVGEEYLSLLTESVRLRFRSDVPVGINLSGGLDSSILLGLVQRIQGVESDVKAFTFATGDDHYDELPWVRRMLARTRHPSSICFIKPEEVPAIAARVQEAQDEPFGGLPTLAYARLFERARAEGVIVLLDGQGLDEQWAGYDYYAAALNGGNAGLIQGTKEKPVRPDCLTPEFRQLVDPFTPPQIFGDPLRNWQYRDACLTKLPRALRFNDRISMCVATELREPFLDHRLFELSLRQPLERKIFKGTQKWLLRRIVRSLLPEGIVESPKRPVQTPQREWLRGPLREWATENIDVALEAFGDQWLEPKAVRGVWRNYCDGIGDNSFFVWQWINLGLMTKQYISRCRT